MQREFYTFYEIASIIESIPKQLWEDYSTRITFLVEDIYKAIKQFVISSCMDELRQIYLLYGKDNTNLSLLVELNALVNNPRLKRDIDRIKTMLQAYRASEGHANLNVLDYLVYKLDGGYELTPKDHDDLLYKLELEHPQYERRSFPGSYQSTIDPDIYRYEQALQYVNYFNIDYIYVVKKMKELEKAVEAFLENRTKHTFIVLFDKWLRFYRETHDIPHFWDSTKKMAQTIEIAHNSRRHLIAQILPKYRDLVKKVKKKIFQLEVRWLIESLKPRIIYPKKLSFEILRSKLANLYVGSILLSYLEYFKDKEDIDILKFAIFDDGVIPVVQSIFYDTIGHYNQEVRDFLFKAIDHFEDIMVKLDEFKNRLPEKEKKELNELIKKIDNDPCIIHLLRLAGDAFKYYYPLLDVSVSSISINNWVEALAHFDSHNWKEFTLCGVRSYPTVRNLFNELKNFLHKLDNNKTVSDLLSGVIVITFPFRYMDEPYYKPFHTLFYPLYELIKDYNYHTVSTLQEIITLIDRLKDIQHHSDFFWNSFDRKLIEFISNAKLTDLLPYVDNKEIKSIYKKYKVFLP